MFLEVLVFRFHEGCYVPAAEPFIGPVSLADCERIAFLPRASLLGERSAISLRKFPEYAVF